MWGNQYPQTNEFRRRPYYKRRANEIIVENIGFKKIIESRVQPCSSTLTDRIGHADRPNGTASSNGGLAKRSAILRGYLLLEYSGEAQSWFPAYPMKILTSTLFLLVSVPLVFGCSYSSNPDPPIEYIVGRTESIYLGKLIQHKFRNKKEDGYKYKVHNLVFGVEKVLKGAVKERFEVEIWERLNKRDSCYDPPAIPRLGESWVFHENYKEPNPVRYLRGNSDLFWRFDAADEGSGRAVTEITSIASNPKSTFFGQIDSGDFGFPDDVKGIRVALHRTTGEPIPQRAVFTENKSLINGVFFKFEDLAPGKYTLRISASKPLLFDGVYMGMPDIRLKRSGFDEWFFADFTIDIQANLPEFHCFSVRQ